MRISSEQAPAMRGDRAQRVRGHRLAGIASLMAESQLLVVNAQQVHAGRVKIVDVHLVFNDAESELVSRSIGQPSFHPASSHPDTEALVVVITAERGQLTRASIVLLHHRSTSKF